MRARYALPPSMVVAVTTGRGSVAYTRRQSIKGVVGMTEADTLDALHLPARAAARARRRAVPGIDAVRGQGAGRVRIAEQPGDRRGTRAHARGVRARRRRG